MILVFGSSGTTGGEVARQLVAAGHRPRLLVRRPEKAREFVEKAEIVEGDLSNAGSLDRAFAGIEKVFLVTAGVRGPELEAHAIDRAKKAGVRHVVKLSVVGADDPRLTFGKWHAQSEQHLIASGLAWTMVRPGNFMTNSLAWAESIRAQSVFYAPVGEGRWPAIDPADIGAVAVAALTVPSHEGKAYTCTGPESLNAAEYAAKLGNALGKEITFVDVPPEAARAEMAKAGMPEAYLDAIMELLAAMKANRLDSVADGVEQAIGRKPGSFGAWVTRNLAAFQ